MAGEFASGLVSIGSNRGDIIRKQRMFDDTLRKNQDDRAAQQAQMGVMQFMDQRRQAAAQQRAAEEAQAARVEQAKNAEWQAREAQKVGLSEFWKSQAGVNGTAPATKDNSGLSSQDQAKTVGVVKQVVGGNEAIMQAGNLEAGIGKISKAYDEAAKSGNPTIYKYALAASGLHSSHSSPADYTVKTEYDPKTRDQYMLGYLGGKLVSRNATGRKSEADQKDPFNPQTHQDRTGKELNLLMGGKLDPFGQMSLKEDTETRYAKFNNLAQGISRQVGKNYSPGEIAGAVFEASNNFNAGVDAKKAQAQAINEADSKAGWFSTDATDFNSEGGDRNKFIERRKNELVAGDDVAALRLGVMKRLGVPQANALDSMPAFKLTKPVLDRAQAAIKAGADPAAVQARLKELEDKANAPDPVQTDIAKQQLDEAFRQVSQAAPE